jgi:hypothetical protein
VEGFSGLIFLAIVYAVLSLISKAQKGRGTPSRKPPPGKGKTWYPEPPPEHMRTAGTQAEGARLQELLKAMEGVQERAARGPSGRETSYQLRGAEEVEERESLEIERAPYVRPERKAPVVEVVDYDDEANAVVQRRIREAEARNRPLTKADHQAFDARIRQKKVDVSTGVPDHIQQLRDAMIWKEILGKPVSEKS